LHSGHMASPIGRIHFGSFPFQGRKFRQAEHSLWVRHIRDAVLTVSIPKGFDEAERLLQPVGAQMAPKEVLLNWNFVPRWQSAQQIFFQRLLREMLRNRNALNWG